MTPDITRLTLGELISDPDTVIQRHAHGIVKRLRGKNPPKLLLFCRHCKREIYDDMTEYCPQNQNSDHHEN